MKPSKFFCRSAKAASAALLAAVLSTASLYAADATSALPTAVSSPPPILLPAEAAKEGAVITVDLTTNTAQLFVDGQLVKSSRVASGSEKVLRQGSRFWLFRTPRGRHTVLAKIKDPVWHKPDWAFVEEGKPIPPVDSPLRLQKGKMGKYALDLGDGILLHGTDDPKSIGKRVSHGCIRMPNDMLQAAWDNMSVGAEVWIIETAPRTDVAERHSDLDYLR